MWVWGGEGGDMREGVDGAEWEEKLREIRTRRVSTRCMLRTFMCGAAPLRCHRAAGGTAVSGRSLRLA